MPYYKDSNIFGLYSYYILLPFVCIPASFFPFLILARSIISLSLTYSRRLKIVYPDSNPFKREAGRSSWESCGASLLWVQTLATPFANLETLDKLREPSVPQFVPHKLNWDNISPCLIIICEVLKVLPYTFKVNTW